MTFFSLSKVCWADEKHQVIDHCYWYCNYTVLSSRQGFPYRVRWWSVQTPHGDHPRKTWKLVETSSWSELHNYVIAVMWRGNYVVVTEREVHGKSTAFGCLRLDQRWEVMWPGEITVESATAKLCCLLELNAVGWYSHTYLHSEYWVFCYTFHKTNHWLD